VGPGALAQVLRPLTAAFSPTEYPDLLVGLQVADDAAVYRLNERQALVQTLDFFAPVLDDPYFFGAVAAANALSDVYAMGGEVLFALNIAAFPDTLPVEVVSEIFRGGAEKVREAGAVVAGGHSIYDAEPKYGLAVTGTVPTDRILTKGGARAGDRLFLTKPLGTGVLCSSLKDGAVNQDDLEAAVASMLLLNRTASRLAVAAGATAMTDVSGFGLLGHGDEVARASGARLVFQAGAVPALPGAIDAVQRGVRTGGSNRNEEYVHERVHIHPDVPRQLAELLYDPQTSGGLLISIPHDRAAEFSAACLAEGQGCWAIGRVEPGTGIDVQP
jgi:selenide,water dikinase